METAFLLYPSRLRAAKHMNREAANVFCRQTKRVAVPFFNQQALVSAVAHFHHLFGW